MAKTDNTHALRLYESLLKHSDESTAERIANKIPLSKSANIDKKFLWAENVCSNMQTTFADDKIKEIRMDCACGPEMGKLNSMKKIYSSTIDMVEFSRKINDQKLGFTI